MSAPSYFVDTNVFLYLFDRNEPSKRLAAAQRLAAIGTHTVVSTQVLQEFYNNAIGKLKLERHVARAAVADMARNRVVLMRPEMVLAAIDTCERNSISFWDALIVEAAVEGRCDVLLTEDLQHGQEIRGVRVENPFLASKPSA